MKNYAKADVKLFWLCTILVDFITLTQLFYPIIIVQTRLLLLGQKYSLNMLKYHHKE